MMDERLKLGRQHLPLEHVRLTAVDLMSSVLPPQRGPEAIPCLRTDRFFCTYHCPQNKLSVLNVILVALFMVQSRR